MISLPQGWTHEFIGNDFTVFFAPDKQGMVTIDYKRRGYRGGYNTWGCTLNSETYSGRGWKDNLERDALQWLQDVLK
jgi:hypothetical protein